MSAKGKVYDVHAVGKRKTAIARVYMVKGSGEIRINKQDHREYFKKEAARSLESSQEILRRSGIPEIPVSTTGSAVAPLIRYFRFRHHQRR